MKYPTWFIAAALASGTLFANGTRLPYQDMEAVSRGYAFAATADTPGAVYYNPAGIAQMSTGAAEAGVYFLRPTTEFSSGTRFTEAKTRTFALPYLFAAEPIPTKTVPIVIGAGTYAPFGLSSDWDPSASGFRTLATSSSLVFRRYALSAAAKTGDFMVGGSLEYNRMHADLSRGIGYVPGDRINFTGTGQTWSYNAGVIYRPAPEHSFGLQYQSRANVELAGTTSYSPLGFGEASSLRWSFPSNYTLSYSYRPTQDWNLEVGYDRTHWSCVNTLLIQRQVSGPLPLVFGWKDSSYYEFGGTRSWRSGWQVSAGGCWSGNSVPTATFNPTVVDYDRWLWNAGVGYRTASWRISTLVQYSPTTTRAVSGSLRSAAQESADGVYRARLCAFGLQAVVGW